MQRATPGDAFYRIVVGGLAGLGLLILLAPVVIVIVTSFTTSQSLRFPPPDLSLRWYRELFDPARSAQIHAAAWNSVWVAGAATLVGTGLSVLAALPTLSYGLAALMFFSVLGVRPSLSLLIAGHLVVIAPFAFRTTLASLTQLDPSLLEASANLGASRLYGFRRITLPLIAPGILAGAFLAFVSSMDNVPVSLFLSNARNPMLPIRMWGMMESTLDVRIAAIAGVLILATLVLMVVVDRLTGLTRRMSA
jgi:putative spermidine/putrescine transport system permease protein